MFGVRRAFFDTANMLVMLDDSPHFRREEINFKRLHHSAGDQSMAALRLLESCSHDLTDLCSGVA
jgi:hypothetical protein